MVSNVDFAETFLDAAGSSVPGDMQGAESSPDLAADPDAARAEASFYYEYYEYPVPHNVHPHHGVVTDQYKLVYGARWA